MQKLFKQYPIAVWSEQVVLLSRGVAPSIMSSSRSSTTAPQGGFEAARLGAQQSTQFMLRF
ncbi:hypothetical protein HUJ04_009578 [Dendroctonus ponderosae]|nr:hypothetical protein HUJ04_009578 [Dendroctonus ponderosae]